MIRVPNRHLPETKDTPFRRRATSAVLGLIGIALIGVGYWMGLDGQKLATDGIETNAVIVSKSKTRRRGSSSRTVNYLDTNKRSDHKVRYRFETHSGQLSMRKAVSRSFYDSVNRGDSVPIRYLADNPKINEIEAGRFQTHALIAGGIGALFLLGGLAAMFWPRKSETLVDDQARSGPAGRAQ